MIWEALFWKTVKSCWGNMSQQVLHQLVESTPGGVHAAIKAKGGEMFLNLCVFFKDLTFHSISETDFILYKETNTK